MAKQSGLGDNLYVGGYNLSGDIGSLSSIAGPQKPIEVTGIDKSAFERIGGQRDGSIEFMAYFNPETIAGGGSRDGEHVVLSALPTTDVACMYCRGTVLGSPVANMIGKQINYDPTRDDGGALNIKVAMQANGYGLEWGQLLTAGLRTDTVATLGTSIDMLAASSFGFQAYLQVSSMAGTDVTVKLQDSADNVTFADVASGAFAVTTLGRTTQRIAVGGTATLRRYVRATTVTTGGFTSLVFAVAVIKNTTAVSF